VELRSTFEALPDVRVVWVMADSQVNEGLRDRIVFAVDPASAAIDRLGLRLENAEPMEQGVPHPTTYVLDREGVVRFADSRRDYHFWLDAERIAVAVQGL
jgi:peroxiredoxin